MDSYYDLTLNYSNNLGSWDANVSEPESSYYSATSNIEESVDQIDSIADASDASTSRPARCGELVTLPTSILIRPDSSHRYEIFTSARNTFL